VREDRPTASAEPWSEVPADVQELLRAEMARRQTGGGRTTKAAAEPAAAEPVTEAVEAPAKPTRRRTKAATTAGEG
jgi:hypothetical protein